MLSFPNQAFAVSCIARQHIVFFYQSEMQQHQQETDKLQMSIIMCTLTEMMMVVSSKMIWLHIKVVKLEHTDYFFEH